jgi:hypothetical protein
MESDSDEDVGGVIHRRMAGGNLLDDIDNTIKGVVTQMADPLGTFKRRVGKLAGGRKKKGAAPRGMDEATAMGLHLAKHLHGLHGDDFVQKFGAGMVGGAMMCSGRGMSGAGFFDDLKHAFSADVWDPQKNGVAQAFEQFGQNVKHEFVDPNSTLRGQVIPMASQIANVVSAIPGVGEVLAPITMGIKAADYANRGAKAVGLGKRGKGKLVITHGGAAASKSGAYEGEGIFDDIRSGKMKVPAVRQPQYRGTLEDGLIAQQQARMPRISKVNIPTYGMKGEGFWDDIKGAVKGAVSSVAQQVAADPVGSFEKAKKGYEMARQVLGKGGKKKRAPAGPNDGRRKRAEVVKRVMAEKGLSMIEASKYVKAHGLY